MVEGGREPGGLHGGCETGKQIDIIVRPAGVNEDKKFISDDPRAVVRALGILSFQKDIEEVTALTEADPMERFEVIGVFPQPEHAGKDTRIDQIHEQDSGFKLAALRGHP